MCRRRQSVIRDQVRNGVAVRMAVLADVIGRAAAQPERLAAHDQGKPRDHFSRRCARPAADGVRRRPVRLRARRLNAPRMPNPAASYILTCDPAIPMRRPLSIMAAEPQAGWIEISTR